MCVCVWSAGCVNILVLPLVGLLHQTCILSGVFVNHTTRWSAQSMITHIHTLTPVHCSVWILRRAVCWCFRPHYFLLQTDCDQSYEFFSKIDASGWKCCQIQFVPSPFDTWIWNAGRKMNMTWGEFLTLFFCVVCAKLLNLTKPCYILLCFRHFIYQKNTICFTMNFCW